MADTRQGPRKAKAKSKHISTKKSTSAKDKHSTRSQKALDKQFAKAQQASLLQAGNSAVIHESVPSSSRGHRNLSPDVPDPSAVGPSCFEESFAPFDCFLAMDVSSVPLPVELLPSTSASPAPTMTFIAHPTSTITQEMCDYIAIIQGVEAAFQHRDQWAPSQLSLSARG